MNAQTGGAPRGFWRRQGVVRALGSRRWSKVASTHSRGGCRASTMAWRRAPKHPAPGHSRSRQGPTLGRSVVSSSTSHGSSRLSICARFSETDGWPVSHSICRTAGQRGHAASTWMSEDSRRSQVISRRAVDPGQPAHGLTTRSPIPENPSTSRVPTEAPCTSAMAAMNASAVPIGLPNAPRAATISA